MLSTTLYRCDEAGRPHKDTPIARITVDDDGKLEIRMRDGGLLVCFENLEHLGYTLMWANYGDALAAAEREAARRYARARLRPS